MTNIKLTEIEIDNLISELNTVRPNMKQHGGNFEQALAYTLQFADIRNVKKIKEAFSDEWNKFLNWNKQ